MEVDYSYALVDFSNINRESFHLEGQFKLFRFFFIFLPYRKGLLIFHIEEKFFEVIKRTHLSIEASPITLFWPQRNGLLKSILVTETSKIEVSLIISSFMLVSEVEVKPSIKIIDDDTLLMEGRVLKLSTC